MAKRFNPFRTFQRNQKGCMAGATLLAMISFLFLGVIIQLFGGRGGPGSQNETLAESRRFGKITSFDLQRLRDHQESLRRFLFELYRKLADPNDEAKMQTLYPLQMFAEQAASVQNSEQLINTWLVTQYVQTEGVSPDWNDIQNLLKELTGNTITDAVYTDTLNATGLSPQHVEYLLARQLRWRQAMERFNLSVSAITPVTRWDWYQRLYRQVTIEAAAVPVDSLIQQVGDPSNSQLNAFFEQNKTKRYNPMSAESGFLMPTELAFQYVVAEPTQKLLDSITEEEMRTYYDENKETQFRKITRPPGDYPQLPGMMPGGAMPFPTPGRSMMPMIPAPADDVSTLPELPNVEESTGESTLPAPDAPPALDETPAPDVPQPEESAPETSAVTRVRTLLVSYQNDETETATATEGLASPALEEPPAPDSSAPPDSPSVPDDDPVDLSILYRPFDDVKDQIRDTLAREKAAACLPIIQEKMKEYSAVYNEHIEQRKPAPPMIDLTEIAAEQGLELKTVPMGDVYTAMRTELARGSQERQYLAQMFRRVPLLFEGETFPGSNGLVLIWVTDEKKEMRPTKLDEVKEIVLKRWKEIEARSSAQKKAEEFADEAKASGKPLAEVFAGRNVPVAETEPFTWKSYGGLNPIAAVMRRIPPMLGEVREKGVVEAAVDNQVIVAPGSDFMETVFSLQVGEIGVVFNEPQSAAYIVRVTSSTPSTDVLWERFQGAYIMEYLYAGQPEMVSAAFEAWINEIRKKTGFRWVHKPDALESERYGGYDE